MADKGALNWSGLYAGPEYLSLFAEVSIFSVRFDHDKYTFFENVPLFTSSKRTFFENVEKLHFV